MQLGYNLDIMTRVNVGFKPGRGRWIFLERKNPKHDFLRKESKAVDPVS